MELMNCPKCGKLFARDSNRVCNVCAKIEEDLFLSVKEYLDEHPDCKLDEVSKETGASVKKIMRYLKEGRLEISKGMTGELRCQQCNAPITSGLFCDKCVKEINQTVDTLFTANKSHMGGSRRMTHDHFKGVKIQSDKEE